MRGEVIAGKYRIEGELGVGGMGTVYRARVIKTAKPVAIKLLRPDVIGVEQFESRFSTEVILTAKVAHPNIVEVRDHGYLHDGRQFLVLELLSGRNLGDILENCHHLEWPRALRITREVALALGAVHKQDVVHRDIKPENIYLIPHANGESVKLMDFGLAKSLIEDDFNAERTQPGYAVGTPAYMAPERVAGDCDGRADLYGLAIVCYEMLAGHPPFTGEPTEVLAEHLTKTPRSLSEANQKVVLPAPVQRFMDRALAKQVEDRHRDAEHMIRDIDGALAREEDLSISPSAVPDWAAPKRSTSKLPITRPAARGKMIALGAIACGLTVIVLSVALSGGGDSTLMPETLVTTGPQEPQALVQDPLPSTGQGEQADAQVSAVADAAPMADLRLQAELEALTESLSEAGFSEAEGSQAQKTGALGCRQGQAAQLQVGFCIYSDVEAALQAKLSMANALEAATTVVLSREHRLLWITDEENSDPEGRGIQALVESFVADR